MATVIRHRKGRWRRAAQRAALTLVLVCLLAGFCTVAAGQSETPGEYQVKAVFLYNFTKFVEWPEGAIGPLGTTIKICIIGKDSFGPAADIIRGKVAQDRVVQVLVKDKIDDALDQCHVLFIAASPGDSARILEATRGRPILTVSDTPGFTSMGGMINLVTVDKKIRFEINAKAANDCGLLISSALMKLALPQKE